VIGIVPAINHTNYTPVREKEHARECASGYFSQIKIGLGRIKDGRFGETISRKRCRQIPGVELRWVKKHFFPVILP
jgi:hypothetical protein